MNIKELLDDLTGRVAISGFEREFSEYVAGLFGKICNSVEIDAFGNIVARKNAGKGFKKIMIEAHLDEIGLMISYVEDNGFLRFTNIGGIDPAILPASEVVVHGQNGQEITGIICAKPPHLQSSDERKKTIKMDDLYIDIGLDGERARETVHVGDIASFVGEGMEVLEGRYVAKSLDNRAGVAALLACAERLVQSKAQYELIFLVSVQEEVGLRGAEVGAYAIKPDCAVVVDVTHGTSPDVSEREGFALGSGVAIAVGPNIDRGMYEIFEVTAEEAEIPYEIEVCPASSGTNAWVIQVAVGGVPCAVLSIPLRYMHTAVEMLCLEDVSRVSELICRAIEEEKL